MKGSAAARRFAKALITIGVEHKATGRYGEELRDAAAVFKATPELYKMLLNPMYKLEERCALMDKVSSSVKASEAVSIFFNILVSTRSIKLLEDIAAAYQKFEDALAGRLRATIEAPFEPSAAFLEEIRGKLKGLTGKEIIVSYRRRPELIGGLVVRMDNTVIDGSLKTQLNLMKEKILEGVA